MKTLAEMRMVSC